MPIPAYDYCSVLGVITKALITAVKKRNTLSLMVFATKSTVGCSWADLCSFVRNCFEEPIRWRGNHGSLRK